MLVKRRVYESIKQENSDLSNKLELTQHALEVITRRHEERGKQILKLEARIHKLEGKHDPKTGQFIKK